MLVNFKSGRRIGPQRNQFIIALAFRSLVKILQFLEIAAVLIVHRLECLKPSFEHANDANSPVPFSRLCDARIVQVANASGDLHGAAFPMICVQSDIAHSFLPLPRRSHDHCGGR